jgi:hypothetical protein
MKISKSRSAHCQVVHTIKIKVAIKTRLTSACWKNRKAIAVAARPKGHKAADQNIVESDTSHCQSVWTVNKTRTELSAELTLCWSSLL